MDFFISNLLAIACLRQIKGMEDLIRQAFLHVEVIGPHVSEGHYDLVGPNGDIILPQVWETVVEPDWTITMHMWPIPDKPKADPPAPAPGAAEPPAGKKKADSSGVSQSLSTTPPNLSPTQRAVILNQASLVLAVAGLVDSHSPHEVSV